MLFFSSLSRILEEEYKLNLNKQEAIFLRQGVFWNMRLCRFSIKAISLLVMNHRRTDTVFRWDMNTQMLPCLGPWLYIFNLLCFEKIQKQSGFCPSHPTFSRKSHFLLLNRCLRYLVKQCRPGSLCWEMVQMIRAFQSKHNESKPNCCPKQESSDEKLIYFTQVQTWNNSADVSAITPDVRERRICPQVLSLLSRGRAAWLGSQGGGTVPARIAAFLYDLHQFCDQRREVTRTGRVRGFPIHMAQAGLTLPA